MTGFVLGAYVAAPPGFFDDDDLARGWFGLLRDEPLVGGLELAWDRELFADGAGRLAGLVDPGWSSVVTMMAGVSARLSADSRYGLASADEPSRLLAVADVTAAHREIMALRAQLGPHAVRAIQIQSSPSASAGASPDAFTRSLRTVLELGWDDVAVVVEHCDGSDGVQPQKAFLPLRTEIECLQHAAGLAAHGARSGHSVNWARSVIEARSADGAEQAIRTLQDERALTGLMFSGVAPVATAFGGEWRDSHLPVADGGDGSEPASLLTSDRVARALALVGSDVDYVGAKVSARKVAGLALRERLAPSLATLRVMAETVPA
ncbi:MAG: DUF4862 family protein [Cellulomonas sp.]|uniref:DUF4862 family protein n=1 Tax=Cellulomonas sp. 73-92 TaxID=1895740 RepID=UPI0009265A9E|nr:DUF4862 family protein [Cellulomonas sp. 73-92]MBN9375288.1 DUF4862 family protein [Cellulomonas sp.]OJV84216.1 MAG: hypothetical protein BGO37_01650 [Cellulomonas sp. 73-92]